MAKKGKAGGGGPVAQITQGVSSVKIAPGGDQQVQLFPPRPKRDGDGPGTKVQLKTNLFKMSPINGQEIYRFDVQIDVLKDVEQPKEGGAEKLPRKLSKEIRRMALKKALEGWLRENPLKAPKKSYNYVYDNNASALYALFNMFVSNKSDKKMELDVEISLDTIMEKKVATRKEKFRVKFFQSDTSVIDINKLFEYCNPNSKIGSDITRIQECIRAVNVILHGDLVNIDRFVVTTFSVFDFEGMKWNIGPKVLLREGFSMSARPTATDLVLNVSNSFNAFHEETDLISLLQDRFGVRDLTRPLPAGRIADLLKEIKNKQVEARHINLGTKAKPHYRKYRVNSIEGNCLQKFTLVDKEKKTTKEITIQDYFKSEYKVTLRYPNLPCIVNRGRKIPLEVCHLIDKQRVSRKLTGDETAKTITAAALKPQEHFKFITDHVKLIGDHCQPLTDFGISFDMKPIEVTGRELTPTHLMAQGLTAILPKDGQYNVHRERFLKGARIGNWALVALLDQETLQFKGKFNDLGQNIFNQLYSRAAKQKGMMVGKMLPAREIKDADKMNEDKLKRVLKEEFTLYNDRNVAHVIFLLSDRCPDFIYRYLKYLETIRLGEKKQTDKFTRVACLKLRNYDRKIVSDPGRASMFVSNLLLKCNTKHGGINFGLSGDPNVSKYLAPGYIFISIDVCHPAPGDKLAQSVAAAVGMWDLNNAERSYRTCIRVQHKARENHSTVEDVGEVDKMFEDILEAYKAKKRTLPSNIVILRDGVSEGQLKIVLEGELRKINAMLSRKYSTNKLAFPDVACMVVQKRHKVRFMLKEPVKIDLGPRGIKLDHNIQPGTVVDREIIHPTHFDFYLAPHKAIQGTSRAAHIYVIHDEIGFSQDDAESMMHALSYLSPRCTKSTSIPTPVNLADRAAERGKNLVICWQEEFMRGPKKGKAGQVGFADDQLSKLNEYLQQIGDANYRNTLFYI